MDPAEREENKIPKYGDKRPDYVTAKLFLARMSGVAREKGGYDRMGYWEDLGRYQGKETYYKLDRLRQDIMPAVYHELLAILKEDDAANPLD